MSKTLMRYLDRHPSVLERTDGCLFAAGAAAYILAEAWGSWTEEFDKGVITSGSEVLDLAPEPRACDIAKALMFTGAVATLDPHCGHTSIAVTTHLLWNRLYPERAEDLPDRNWLVELGFYLAAETSGAGISWEDDNDAHGLVLPQMELCDPSGFVASGRRGRKRIIIVGCGGSGKDHLARELGRHGWEKAVSVTTRPPREGEVNGKDYQFVTEEEFRKLIEAEELLEYYSFGDKNWLYGTTNAEAAVSDVFIMSPPVLRIMGDARKDFTVVYLHIPEDVRRDRLAARGDADSVDRRLAADRKDFDGFEAFDILITHPYFEVEDVLRHL